MVIVKYGYKFEFLKFLIDKNNYVYVISKKMFYA